eukprot:scaffold95216_cov68-Attheya_sp.AAC.13
MSSQGRGATVSVIGITKKSVSEDERYLFKNAPTPSKNGMWNLLTSAHDVNIGTTTEITVAFEKVANQNILDS